MDSVSLLLVLDRSLPLSPPSYMPQSLQDISPCGRCCSQHNRDQARNLVLHPSLGSYAAP
ncbi:hypothetical protein BD311DRAFT_769153 [Dichomitus squalens]|uniref:Uncharacterized protein n=1 Tax=Dichomitus squalens TaxID=114155 RepID=A0A4Q9M826_9APHY|nr:hypothetical protein BD311DRAFT_769153 [Dichomitus squalens]